MPGLAILCSGQGRQAAGMFTRLLEYPEAQLLMQRIRAAGVLPDRAAGWLDNPAADPDLIRRNEMAQPLIVLHQMLTWEIVKTQLPAPDLFAGYSLGELAAYGCAGVFQPAELVRLAAIRGRLMTAAAVMPQTLVAVIGLKRDPLDKICAEFKAHVAIINANDHFIVGLPQANVKPFLAGCEQSGATKTARLPVSVAAHTPFMQTAAESFKRLLPEAACGSARGGILAGVSGEKVFSKEQMIAALARQVHQTVDWRACMENAVAYGCRIFLELGPGDSLAKMMRAAFPETDARSLSEFHDLRAVNRWVDAASSRSR